MVGWCLQLTVCLSSPSESAAELENKVTEYHGSNSLLSALAGAPTGVGHATYAGWSKSHHLLCCASGLHMQLMCFWFAYAALVLLVSIQDSWVHTTLMCFWV